MLLARSVEDRVRPRRRKSGGVLDDPSQAGANPKRGAASCSLTGSAPLLDCRPPPTVEPAHPLKPGVWVTVNMQVQGYPYERREPPSHRHCTPRARRVKSDCYSVVDTSTVLPPSLLGFTGTVCLKLASQIGAAHCR